MSDRTMSPTAAEAHAKRIVRARFKALRQGKRVDPPLILAGRLVEYAQSTAAAYPVKPSRAYREYVEATFHERYVELCRTTPLSSSVHSLHGGVS